MEEETVSRYFHVVDYVVFCLVFASSLAIGFYFAYKSRKNNTTEEYLMGGRKLMTIPTGISICVSVVSANTLLGAPAEMYTYGIMYLFVLFPILAATIITVLWYVPLFYPLNLMSCHKYLHMRFKSKTVLFIGTLLQILTQTLYIGCVIFGPATALETVTGIPSWASIILVSVIGTAYTSLGGMKAVIWTDVFQFMVMFAGVIAIIVKGTYSLGGFSKVIELNRNMGRFDINHGSGLTDRFTFVSLFIGFTTYWVAGFGVNQPCVQRFCAMETLKKGKLSMLMNAPGFLVFKTLSIVAGMVVFAYYDNKGCDPLAGKIVNNGNQITPYFVMETLNYPGVPGLFVASLFSGSLSTLSSSINSLSAVVWEDILEGRYGHRPDIAKTRIVKLLSVFFGMLCMVLAFVVMSIGGNLIQMASSFFGVAIGPLLGLFTLGALIPWANWIGAVTGSVIGVVFNFWIMTGQVFTKAQRLRLPSKTMNCPGNYLNETFTSTASSMYQSMTTDLHVPEVADKISGVSWLYSISFSWYPFIGFILVLVIGMIVSALTAYVYGHQPVEKHLLFPCVRSYGVDGTAISIDKEKKMESIKKDLQLDSVVEKTRL